jgi:glucose/arabinose dehydrogenase
MKRRSWQLLGILALAACGSPAPTNAQEPNGSSMHANVSATRPPFTTATVATFDAPWAMDFLPGSTVALVTEKGGHLWLVDVANGKKQEVGGAPRVVAKGQGGLLDVKVSPHFAEDGFVYLTFSEPSQNGGSQLALARGKLVRGASPALQGLTVIWRNPTGGQGGHFGARIAFPPDGNSLFLSAGERQRFMPAQDPNLPMGKVLHLTPDGNPAPGNPGAGKTGAATVSVTDPPEDSVAARNAPARSCSWPGPNLTPAETWTSGHRNPLGLAFAPDGRLWEIEMGPRGGDELNLILEGRNYGYPRVSNGTNYNGVDIPDHQPGDGFEAPKAWWNPSISPADLLIYSGSMFPEWEGDALIPALSGQALIHVKLDGDHATKAEEWDMGKRIRAVDQGPDGAVYLLEDEGGARLLRLTPAQTRR